MQIQIQSVNIENVRNGKNAYDKATVNFLVGGQTRDQKIMSFSNPAVFKQVREMKAGEFYEVEITKNAQGYNQWAKVTLSDGKTAAPSAVPAKSGGSWETAEERAKKQLLIVKQSSLAQSVAYHTTKENSPAGVDEIIETAQIFTDWIMNPNDDLFSKPNDIEFEDVPH